MVEELSFSKFLPEHIDYCQNRFSSDNLINAKFDCKAIVEYAEAICHIDHLLDPDVDEINKLIQKLSDEKEYLKFKEIGISKNQNHPSYITHFIAESLILYLHEKSSTLTQIYQIDKKRHGIIEVIVKKNTQCNDVLRKISISEGTSPFNLVNILMFENITPALISYATQNLHQRAILSLTWLCDSFINIPTAYPEGYLNKLINKLIDEYKDKTYKIKFIIDSVNNHVLNIEINFYRERKKRSSSTIKDFIGKYTLEITDYNNENEENISNIKVRLIDYQFDVVNKEYYAYHLKDKLNTMIKKIVSKETLTSKDQKDIQSLLAPHLKLKFAQKIVRTPIKIEDNNMLFLLFSQGYMTEVNNEIKNRKLSEREKIVYATLFNRADKLNQFTHRNKINNQKNKMFLPVLATRALPLNTLVDNANEPLPWWLRVSKTILPNFILKNISIFEPILKKNKACIELQSIKIDEYLHFLSTTNPADAAKIWQDKRFITNAKNLIADMNTRIENFKNNRHQNKRIVLEESLLSHFLTLSSFARQLSSNQFPDLDEKTFVLIESIFSSVAKVLVPEDKDFEQLTFFKTLLKSDEFFLLFKKWIIDVNHEAIKLSLPENYCNYNQLLSKWVQIYRDPELIRLLFKRKEILEEVDVSTLSKIIDIADETDTIIDIENIKNSPHYTIFTHRSDYATSVHVAGDFNQWLHPENNIIQDDPKWRMQNREGIWTLVAKLEPGTYQFKYVVNHTNWEISDNNKYSKVKTNEGHENLSILIPESLIFHESEIPLISNLMMPKGKTRNILLSKNHKFLKYGRTTANKNSTYDFFMPMKQLDFEEWYVPETFYLLNMVKNNTRFSIILFYDNKKNYKDTPDFQTQLSKLRRLVDEQNKPALFISKEPGEENHFICGILNKSDLLLINPLGLTDKKICYETLAQLQRSKTLGKILLSTDKLQQHKFEENGLASCGPMIFELAFDFLSLSPQMIKEFWSKLRFFSTFTECNKFELLYTPVSIKDILPNKLKSFLTPNLNQDIYKQQMCVIRKSHYNMLRTYSEEYLEKFKSHSPTQTRFLTLFDEQSMIKTDTQNTSTLEAAGVSAKTEVGIRLESESESEFDINPQYSTLTSDSQENSETEAPLQETENQNIDSPHV